MKPPYLDADGYILGYHDRYSGTSRTQGVHEDDPRCGHPQRHQPQRHHWGHYRVGQVLWNQLLAMAAPAYTEVS